VFSQEEVKYNIFKGVLTKGVMMGCHQKGSFFFFLEKESAFI